MGDLYKTVSRGIWVCQISNAEFPSQRQTMHAFMSNCFISYASSIAPAFKPPPPPAMRSKKPFLLISVTFSSLLPCPTKPFVLASRAASSPLTCAALTALNNLTTPLCAVFRNLFSNSIVSCTLGPSATPTTNQSTNQPTNSQPNNQPTNQRTNQPTSPTNQPSN